MPPMAVQKSGMNPLKHRFKIKMCPQAGHILPTLYGTMHALLDHSRNEMWCEVIHFFVTA